MTTTASQNKRKGVLIETLHAVRQLEMVVFVKATEKKLITEEATVLGDSRTYLLGWYLVKRIGLVNLLGVDL